MLKLKFPLSLVLLAVWLVLVAPSAPLQADPPPAAPEYDEPDPDAPPSFDFDIVLQDDSNPGSIILLNSFTGDYIFCPGPGEGNAGLPQDEPAPNGARPNVGMDGGTSEASRSPSGSLSLTDHPTGQAPDAFQEGGSSPQEKAGKAADDYMEQKGVDPSSAAGQVVKPYVVGTTVVDDQWGAQRYGYDPAGRMIRVVDPTGNAAYRYQYDARENRTRVIDDSGGTTRYEYDSAGRLIRSTDPAGRTTTFRYEPNPQGTRIFAANPAGQTTRFQYDVAGRVTRVTDPAGQTTRFQYDARDNRVSVTDPAGNTTRFDYDAAGRATQRTYLDDDGKPSATVSFDPSSGRIDTISLFDLGDSTRTTTDMDGGTTRFSYDAAGRTIQLDQILQQLQNPPSEQGYLDAIDQGMEILYGGMRPLPSGSDSQPGATDLPPIGGPVGPLVVPQPGPSPLDEVIEQLQNPPSAEDYEKAIDEGMEILYGELIPLPTPGSPEGESTPYVPATGGGDGSGGGAGGGDGSGGGKGDQKEDSMEQRLQEAIDALQQGGSSGDLGGAIDQGMETLYGGLIPLPTPGQGAFTPGPDVHFQPTGPLPPTGHEPAHLQQRPAGPREIQTEIIQMDLTGSSPQIGPVRVQTSGPTQNFTHRSAGLVNVPGQAGWPMPFDVPMGGAGGKGGAGDDGGEGADEGGGEGTGGPHGGGFVSEGGRIFWNNPNTGPIEIPPPVPIGIGSAGSGGTGGAGDAGGDGTDEGGGAAEEPLLWSEPYYEGDPPAMDDPPIPWPIPEPASQGPDEPDAEGGAGADGGAGTDGGEGAGGGDIQRVLEGRARELGELEEMIKEFLDAWNSGPIEGLTGLGGGTGQNGDEPPIYSNLIPLPTPNEPEAPGGAGMDGGEGGDGSAGAKGYPEGFEDEEPFGDDETVYVADFYGRPRPSDAGMDGGEGGAGDAGGEGADEGGGETPPGGAGDDGGEGTNAGGGSRKSPPLEDKFYSGADGEVMNLIYGDDHVDPYFPDEPIPFDDPLGGAGDAGGDGADEGGGSTEPPPDSNQWWLFKWFDFINPFSWFDSKTSEEKESVIDKAKELDQETGKTGKKGQTGAGTIPIEMIQMDLTGSSSPLGPVRVRPSGPTQNFTHKDAPEGPYIQVDTEPPVIPQPYSRPEPFTPNSDLNPGADDTLLLFSRDLQVDQFLGSALQMPLPPTGEEFAAGGTLPDGSAEAGTQLARLDPQLDTSGTLDGLASGAGSGASLPGGTSPGTAAPAAGGGGDLAALHDNFHAIQQTQLNNFIADQANQLANNQAPLNTGHDFFHANHAVPIGGSTPDHDNLHNVLDPALANLQAQHDAAIAANQAQKDTDHADFHTQNGIP